MASFGDMITDLRLLLMANQTDDSIGLFLNRAQQQILEAHNWSFLLTNGVINTVAPKATGTITVAQGSPLVLGTGTNFTQADVGSFIWVAGLGTAPIPVVQVGGTAQLTMSSPWCGPTMVKTGYILLPLYYLVEGADEVLAIRQIEKLDKVSREYLNNIDPARLSQGAMPCLKWAPAPASPDGSIQVELWPPASGPLPYLVEFKRKAPIMEDLIDIPLCPYEVIEAKAMVAASRSCYASTGQSSWLELADRYTNEYLEALQSALTEDGRRKKDSNQLVRENDGARALYDANFYPVHGIDQWWE